ERVTKTRLADALYRSAGDLNLHLHAMLLAGDEDRLRQALAGIAAAREAFGQAYEQLQAMPAREGGRKALAAVAAAAAARELAAGRIDGARLEGGTDEAGEVLRAVQATRETLQTLVSDAIELGRQHDLGNISVRLEETA